MADIKAIAEALVGMTTEEVQNLAKVLKDEYGITAEEKVAQTETGMTFGGAIAALKQGKKVARQGWNGKGMFLYLVSAGSYPVKMDAAKSIADENGNVNYGPYVALKAANGSVYPWNASQADMLSNDWEVVE